MAKQASTGFTKGKTYRTKSFFTPIWPLNQPAKCMDTARYPDTEDGIEGGKGLFTVGDDTRYYVWNPDQFEEA